MNILLVSTDVNGLSAFFLKDASIQITPFGVRTESGHFVVTLDVAFFSVTSGNSVQNCQFIQLWWANSSACRHIIRHKIAPVIEVVKSFRASKPTNIF